MPKASHGYGGKFGLQQDRMDKVRLERAYTEPRHELLQMEIRLGGQLTLSITLTHQDHGRNLTAKQNFHSAPV